MAEAISQTTKQPNKFMRWLATLGNSFIGFFKKIGSFFVGIWNIMRCGNWKTRMSFLVMGFGCFAYAQPLRGGLFLAVEIGFVLFMIFTGSFYLSKLGTLGTEVQQPIIDETGLQVGMTEGDNSLAILLFGVSTILIIFMFAAVYLRQLRNAYDNQQKAEFGMPISGAKTDLRNMLDKNFHTTLLALPTLGILIGTLIPLVFMILIAFTNYDRDHITPGNLFTWVGFENFVNLFAMKGTNSMGKTFFSLLGWTLLWAVLATVTTYIGGMILAILINKKGVRFKKIYRGFFVITIAIPQFVSLLVVRQIFLYGKRFG